MPLPSELGRYTTVSQDISLEDGSVVVVTSELEPPDLSLATLSSDPDDDVTEARVLTLSLFLRILWTLEASCTVCRVSE